MIPYYPQPRRQTHPQPQQSQGFQPTQLKPRLQQTAYAQTAQPPVAASSQPYQNYTQYRQSRPAQYFSQQPSQQFTPQRRYAPQSAPQPHPIAVHHTPTSYTPSQPTQLHNPQPHVQSYSSTPPFSYSHRRPGPIIPPVRANSQSPDKGRRPLPDPSATTGVARPRPTSMPPTYAPVPGVRAQSHSAYPSHASSQASASSVPQLAKPPSQTQSFQMHSQHQPPSAPQQSYKSLSHAQAIPNNVQSAQASTHTVESTASRRPLPSPPGESAPSHSSQPVAPSHSSISSAATPPASRRTLPFSPTQSPSVVEGMRARPGTFRSPTRSSTLPPASNNTIEAPGPSDARHIREASEHPVVRISRQTIPAPTSNPQPSSSSLPTQPAPAPSPPRAARTQQGQSLAYRLASLSLHEDQTPKQPAKRALPAGNRTQFKPSAASPLARSGRSAVDLDDTPPPPSIRLPTFGVYNKPAPSLPSRPPVPAIILPGEDEDEDDEDEDEDEDEDDDDDDDEDDDEDDEDTVMAGPSITVSGPSVNRTSHPPAITFSETPPFTVSEPPKETVARGPYFTVSEATPSIMVSEMQAFSSTSSSIPDIIVADLEGTLQTSAGGVAQRRKGLTCYGCGRGIVGRIVSAMGGRWHPACFKCMVCGELLEHVSSYEHDGQPYCHLDYHERFAPQCYHCRTPIIDERFITLDDPALGKRTYHEQHFFCAECGDPFLAPTIAGQGREIGPEGEVVSLEEDVGFTVFKGHPYCESCHVRLRYPKCRRCKKSIRDGMQAVEALGGKWCWECFLCAGCETPFDDPAFFQRDNKAYCEPCFSLIIRNEI